MLNKRLTSIEIITIMKACSTTKGGSVKTAELRRKLLENGAIFIRHGGNHDIWERNGIQTQVPRHPRTKDSTARGILKRLGIKP